MTISKMVKNAMTDDRAKEEINYILILSRTRERTVQ